MTLTSSASAPGVAPRRPVPPGPQRVVAVLVAHDGAPWLPEALIALSRQTRRPDVVVAVDTGSRDDSAAMLRAALGGEYVVSADRSTGFGDAVRTGLAHVSGLPPQYADSPQYSDPPETWVWLLHDDAAPAPGALEHLLDAGQPASVAVVGAKLVDWDDPGVLLEVGLTVGRGGRRDTGLHGPERDQGQHDHLSDVLAVPSAGMLVRRTVWDELGGLDPALPLLRDDIDLCWRVHLAGHRVVLAPRAVVADAQAASTGRRKVHAVRGDVRRVDRQHGLHVALARASWWGLPLRLGWMGAGSMARALALATAGSPGRALAELQALAVVLLLPGRWLGSRWRSRGRRTVPRSSVSALLTPRLAPLRQLTERIGGWAAGRDPDPDDPKARTAPGSGPARSLRLLANPFTTVAALLVAVTAVAWRGRLGELLGPGILTGGELRATGAPAGQLWHAGVDGVRGAGLGTDSLASPAGLVHAGWVALVGLAAGDAAPGLALVLPLLLSPLLAGASAYLAARVVTRARWPRAWAAAVWGGTPLLGATIAGGRVGPVAVTVALPAVAALLTLALRADGSDRARRPGAVPAAALGIALVASVVPLLGVVALAVALLGVVLGGVVLGGPGGRARAAVLVVLPVALLGPWVGELVRRPLLLLAGPGAVDVARPASPIGAPIDTVTGAPLTLPDAWRAVVPVTGWSAWAVLAGALALALVAAVSLLRGGRRGRVVLALGLLAVTGLAIAGAAVAVPLGERAGSRLTAWPGTGLVLALLALVAMPLVATDGLQARLARHGFGWRQVLLAPLLLMAVAGPLAASVVWAGPGPRGPLTRAGGLPAVAVDAAAGPLGTRTLVLELAAGRLSYRLDGGEPGSVARDLPEPSSGAVGAGAEGPVRDAVAALLADGRSPVGQRPGAAGTDTDALRRLRSLAVGFVLVRQPVPAQVATGLDDVPGLARIGRSDDGQLWRVGSGGRGAARARITTAGGKSLGAVDVSGPHSAIDATIAAGPSRRVLVLSEASSTRWRATLDGRPLPAARPGGRVSWQQAFVLPAAGGHLEVSATDRVASAWRWGQLGLAALVLLAALRMRRGAPRPGEVR